MNDGDAIRLSNVTLRHGSRPVLSDVSFSLAVNSFTGLLGANGAGKTTLIRALLGAISPVDGRIDLLGDLPGRNPDGIGYMPQTRSSASYPLLGRDVVASGWHGDRWGLPIVGREGWRAVDEALALVGATELARRRLRDLSGGERQRLLLAQALLGKPKILLLDEPLISLDPAQQQKIVSLVRSIQQELGLCVLFSAHELNPLLGALDQVLYLGAGQAVLGSVDEVITGPVLTRLYGAPIDVIRLQDRIFVMSGGVQIEQNVCIQCGTA